MGLPDILKAACASPTYFDSFKIEMPEEEDDQIQSTSNTDSNQNRPKLNYDKDFDKLKLGGDPDAQLACHDDADSIIEEYDLIDGGVTHNNPTFHLLAKQFKKDPKPDLEDIFILSLGTGKLSTQGPLSD